MVCFRIPCSAWKTSKYGVFSGPYFPVFNPNTGQYGPEITPYLDTFQAVMVYMVYSFTISRNFEVSLNIKLLNQPYQSHKSRI